MRETCRYKEAVVLVLVSGEWGLLIGEGGGVGVVCVSWSRVRATERKQKYECKEEAESAR